jgi:hemoglobin/transferrin/lactoferrin receptor protein
LTLLSGTAPRFAEWYYGPQERLFASYALQLRNGGIWYDEARITVGFQQISETRHDRRFNQNVRNNRYEEVGVLTLNADFARHIGKHEVRYGLDAWNNDVTSTGNTLNIVTGEEAPLSTRYPDGGSVMRSGALYVTHAWEISDKLILNDGIRYNLVELEARFNDKQFFPFPFSEITQSSGNVNGNIGLVYLPTNRWRISFMAASGFRAPNVDDLSKVFESVPGRVIVPNPDLKPESTYNLDLGIQREGNGITAGFNAFYTWYRDAITVRPGLFDGQDSIDYDGQLSQVTTTVNGNNAYLYGVSAFFHADFNDHVSFHTTYNYTFGRFETDTTDYPLDHIAPAFGRSSITARTKKFRGEFFVMYSAAKRSRDYNLIGEDNASYSADPVKGFMPAWMTLNVRAAYQFNRYLQLQIALENMLDQNYRVFSSNISGPGRNLIVTLRSNF